MQLGLLPHWLRKVIFDPKFTDQVRDGEKRAYLAHLEALDTSAGMKAASTVDLTLLGTSHPDDRESALIETVLELQNQALFNQLYKNSVLPYFQENETDKKGRTHLHWAVLLNQTKKVKKLLREHDALGVTDQYNNTLLHFAVSKGYVPLVDLLLKAGANTQARDKRGRTPLHIATAQIAVDLISLTDGLPLGVVEQQREICILRLTKIPIPDVITEKLLEKGDSHINKKDEYAETPLFAAVTFGTPRAVELLLDHGADPNTCDTHKVSALHRAAERNNAAMITLLLNRGAKLKALNYQDKTPPQVAARHNNLHAIKAFIELGVPSKNFGKVKDQQALLEASKLKAILGHTLSEDAPLKQRPQRR